MCQILSRRRVFNKGELVSDEGQKGHCELKSYRVHSRTGQTTGVAPDQGEQCHFTTNKTLNGTQGAPGSGGHLPLGYRTTQGVPEVCGGLCCNSQSSTQHTSSQRTPSQETLSVAVHMIAEPPLCSCMQKKKAISSQQYV